MSLEDFKQALLTGGYAANNIDISASAQSQTPALITRTSHLN
jgi:hypothetical protein